MVDGGANLPKELLKKYGICMLPYNIVFENGDSYKCVKSSKNLIELIKIHNEVPRVDQLSENEIASCFQKEIDKGNDIIYIGSSSALSSSYNDVSKVSERFSPSNLSVIDSLNIGNGQALLALQAKAYIDEGHGYKQTVKYIESIKSCIKSCYMVGSPTYLYRDIRCRDFCSSRFALGYHVPILEICKGKLEMIFNANDGDLAIQVLKNTVMDNRQNINCNYLMISYSGEKTNALQLKKYVNKILNINNIEVVEDNPTIYTNIGNNSLSLAFICNNE